jgi:signal transduction histidine kinase
MVSHEFRTPLGLLTSSADIVYHYWDRLTPEERTTQNTRIHSGVEQIDSLINSILSYNQPEIGAGEASTGSVAVGALCQKIAEEAESVWSSGQVFRLAIAESCGEGLVDELLFRRVVQNLLSNAFSYTEPEGEVSLRLTCNGGVLLLDVSDSGIGIDVGDQKNIFETYFRGQNIGMRRGLGLGLSIVQEALTLMKGSIRVESSLGHGTTMHVEVPLILEPK